MMWDRVSHQLNSYPLRQSLVTGLSLVFAFFISQTCWPAQMIWLAIGACVVAQTARTTLLAQSILALTISISAVLLAYALPIFLNIYIVILLNAGLIVLIGVFFAIDQPLSAKKRYFLILFPLIFLIAQTLLLDSTVELRDRVLALGIGGIVAVICHMLFVPTRFFDVFSKDLLPILRVVEDYSAQFTIIVDRNEYDAVVCQALQDSIENVLQAQDRYPEWVYEFGFNPGLRASFRYFLLNLERIIELYIAVGYLFRSEQLRVQLQEVANEVSLVLKKNTELLAVIKHFFIAREFAPLQDDFTSDMVALEEAARQVVPANIDLLDMSPNYLLLASFVRDVRDIRQLLLQLILTFAKK